MQRIYDSRSQELVDFVPRVPGKVGMYVCGPTVQSAPHIGHLRSALAYDIIRRWLIAAGHDVTFIRNVTDIDDKILDGAAALQSQGVDEQWWALAYRVELQFAEAYRAIGVMSPTYEPRATANIQQMLDLIKVLIANGHAYQASDGSADIYFDTASWPDYGELTRQSPDQMAAAPDGDLRGKKNPADFALWKAHKPGEPESAAWASDWGAGRPGWHIECSAMAKRYLGAEFDIHGGGLDLRFPHHENELAQSRAAGDPFARYWVHNGLVNVSGQKMSKSLGNSVFAAELLKQARPIVLRYFFSQAHYRSVLDFSDESLNEAAAAFERIESFLQRSDEFLLEHGGALADLSERPDHPMLEASAADLWATAADAPADFVAAMQDDFGVPQALAVAHSAVKEGNIALEHADVVAVAKLNRSVGAMLNILGIDPRSAIWQAELATQHTSKDETLAALVTALLQKRQTARANKDFAKSDEIRDQLQQAGVVLEDHATGTRWSVK